MTKFLNHEEAHDVFEEADVIVIPHFIGEILFKGFLVDERVIQFSPKQAPGSAGDIEGTRGQGHRGNRRGGVVATHRNNR